MSAPGDETVAVASSRTGQLVLLVAGAAISGCYTGFGVGTGPVAQLAAPLRVQASEDAEEIFGVSYWLVDETRVSVDITGASAADEAVVEAELVLEFQQGRSMLVLRSLVPLTVELEVTSEHALVEDLTIGPDGLALLGLIQRDVLVRLDDIAESSTAGSTTGDSSGGDSGGTGVVTTSEGEMR